MNPTDVNGRPRSLHVLVAGEGDFVRRLNSFFSKESNLDKLPNGTTFSFGSSSEMKSLCLSLRPDVLVIEIGLRTTPRDLLWLKSRLGELRERFNSELYIILASSAPERFFLAGSLFFAGDTSSEYSGVEPSGLINDLLVIPPASAIREPSIEEQLLNALSYVEERLPQTRDCEVPALGDNDWVPAMAAPTSREVWMRWLPRYARYTNENPLIIGATGTGKTKLAAALHKLSGRTGPFVSITPRDFSNPELVQAELFGAVPGAYTGALEKWGLVKKAEGGTLFVDELQSIDADLQGKLITFIESKSYRRVGEAQSHEANVRFVFASNKPLAQLVAEGNLRDDFAYRLERLQIDLKPISERRLDISAGLIFAGARIIRERSKSNTPTKNIKTPAETLHAEIEGCEFDAYNKLVLATWPGNLRQLENTLARTIELASIKGLPLIDTKCSSECLSNLLGDIPITSSRIYQEALDAILKRSNLNAEELSLDELLVRLSEEILLGAIKFSGNDINQAAAIIGAPEKSLELFAAARTSR